MARVVAADAAGGVSTAGAKANPADRERLTDDLIKKLAAPATGNKITYDSEVKGFGARVTAAGAKAFVLNYREAGRERRYTIGSFPDWATAAARKEAKRLKREVDGGIDPLSRREEDRAAPTVAELADLYIERHLPKKRAGSQANDKREIANRIKPMLGAMKVADIEHEDIDRLHREISKTHRTQANRSVALLSKMFGLAIKWRMRADNPCRGIERNPENRRNRFMSMDELRRLSAALTESKNQAGANAIRLLLLTGARRGEVLGATWDQFDLAAGVWTKPSAHTKQKKDHRVPLSAPALQILTEMRESTSGDLLFPVRKKTPQGMIVAPQASIKKYWEGLCEAAGLTIEIERKGRGGKKVKVTKPSLNVHDLRHTYASILASSGLSLPIIGQLLGHTQPATTARYAHLYDDPLRAATERVGAHVLAVTTAAPAAPVVPIRRGG